MHGVHKLSVGEKVGFSLGDMAGNFVYQSVVLLLAFYYTDVYGLDAATVTAIFLFVRIFDAITDPVMGIIVDRNQSRWGKYRPFLLFLCIPYALASVLVFTVPDLSLDGKTLYAYVTYAVLMMLFTATNIPYFALGSVMTSCPNERVSLNSYRFVAATGGGLIVTAGVIPLADYLGAGDKALGYQQAMMVMAVLSVVLFVICVGSTKERVKPVNNGSRNFKTDIKRVFSNDQWRLLGLAVFVMVTAQTVKATTGVYYLTYYAENAAAMVSLFLSLWMIGGMLGSALANKLTQLMCKKQAWVFLCLLSALLSTGTYFIPANQLVVIMVVQFFVGFFNQMMAPLIFSTMAEVTDYGELEQNRRLDGLISSFTLFALKVGLAIGGALATYLLAIHGYQSGGVDQSGETVDGILLTFTIVPAIGFVLTAFVLHRMKLTAEVVKDNAERLQLMRAEQA
ncbi:MFS transporter [Thalassotalea euphylliae]|uniref:MFS transporter n=1 Tax=Thalassotalea euphylliae TaxID=1655234 RepID=A0A3E0UHF8_9GAMM|nr:MFS transporter [Thalassotalea euphylliae]REL36034.1 MFS transporter [Thalassotalea euphylliae]